MKRLSDAILRGKDREQINHVTHRLYTKNSIDGKVGACAIGMGLVCDMEEFPSRLSVSQQNELRSQFPVLGFQEDSIPERLMPDDIVEADDCIYNDSVEGTIAELNDVHGWSPGAIAEWLGTVEDWLEGKIHEISSEEEESWRNMDSVEVDAHSSMGAVNH